MASKLSNKRKPSDEVLKPLPKRQKIDPMDKRYTDEYVPVTVLHVNVQPSMLGEDVADYFSKFGTVLNINPYKNKQYHGSKNDDSFDMFTFFDWKKAPKTRAPKKFPNWYVRFLNAEDAARILSTNEHPPLGKKVQIAPADNWLHGTDPEPVRCHFLGRTANSNYNPDEKRTQIKDLSDDCLLRIFRYLPNSDLCSVADTCVKFNELAKQKFKKQTIKLRLNLDPSTLTNIKMLPIFGQHMTNIHVQFDRLENHYEYQLKSNYLHRLINAYCPNLEALEWPQKRTPNNSLFTNIKKLRQLEIDCRYESALAAISKMDCLKTVGKLIVVAGSVNKTFYQRMVKLPQLRILHLINMKDPLNLEDLVIIKQLEEIKIGGKCKIGEKNLVQLVTALAKLKVLELENVKYTLTERAYLKLVAICRKRAPAQKLILRVFSNDQGGISESEKAANKKFVEFEYAEPENCCIQ